MTSFVWGREPEEAYANPYEYAAQDQFVHEARALLQRFAEALNPRELRFHCDDRSMEKATWMLHVDALEALRDALELIVEKRHRPAARLFRDIVETMNLAAYFLSGSLKSKSDLGWSWLEGHGPIFKKDCRKLQLCS